MTTKNNWFIPEIKNNIFKIFLEPYSFSSNSFFEACCNQAYDLSKKYDNLYIAYSGGLDSEFVLKTFRLCNLKITPVLLESNYNQEEANWAKEYCLSNKINLEILKLNDIEFIRELKTRTINKGLSILLGGIPLILADYVKEKNGYLLTGYGECFHNNLLVDKRLEFCEYDYYLDLYDNTHPSGFFNYSIEVLYSMIRELDYTIPIQEAKSKLYNLKLRNKIKPTLDLYSIQANLIPQNIKFKKYFYKEKFIKNLENYII
jgi:hypothetical protein